MTEFITSGRQAGKTTALFERMKADDRLIYVAHSQQAARVAHGQARSQGYDFDHERFIGYNEALRTATGPNSGAREVPRYAVDNAELVLSRLLGGTILALTGTGFTTKVPEYVPPRIISHCGHCGEDVDTRGTPFGPTCIKCGRHNAISTRLAGPDDVDKTP